MYTSSFNIRWPSVCLKFIEKIWMRIFLENSINQWIQYLNHDLYLVPGRLCPLFLARTYLTFACFVAGKPDTLCPSYKYVQYCNRMVCLCFNNGMTEDMLMVRSCIMKLYLSYIGKPTWTSFIFQNSKNCKWKIRASIAIIHLKLLFVVKGSQTFGDRGWNYSCHFKILIAL